MRLRRLGLVAVALAAALVAARPAAAGEFTDSAGRRVVLPEQISRIMAAGPASAVFVYVLVPDKLIGWPQALQNAAPSANCAPHLEQNIGPPQTSPLGWNWLRIVQKRNRAGQQASCASRSFQSGKVAGAARRRIHSCVQ